ncbi:hypothetical protein G9A89_008354 [Geosiphon pyriformis]|nr:hypothetical protein G9A89_008354 [Geosiphon pyriformis]
MDVENVMNTSYLQLRVAWERWLKRTISDLPMRRIFDLLLKNLRLNTELPLKTNYDDLYQPEDIDIDSEAFRSLPLETQYEIIGEMRMKSRQASKLTFLEMQKKSTISFIYNANDFSQFQIQNLLLRNNLTQKLLDVTSEEGNMTAPTPVRIASERNREYVLIKNDKNMTGWTIGGVSQKQAEPPKKLKLSLETLVADSSSDSDKAGDSSYEVEPSVQLDESEFNFHPETAKPLSSGQKIIKYPEENEESDWEEIQILPPSPKLISNVEGKKELSPEILPFTEAVDLAPVTFLGSEECDLTPEMFLDSKRTMDLTPKVLFDAAQTANLFPESSLNSQIVDLAPGSLLDLKRVNSPPGYTWIPSLNVEIGDVLPEETIESSDESENSGEKNVEDASKEMIDENIEFAHFLSEIQHKDVKEIRRELDQEINQLNQKQRQNKRDADEIIETMIEDCQRLLTLFGIPYIVAPMEAEAQCAELCRLSLVDGIVTDDSDVFLFGGTCVYKNMFNQQKFVECFLAEDLEREMHLNREKLIQLSLLLGSDYTEGIPGIGIVTAMEILNGFPGINGLKEFKTWWKDVQNGNDACDYKQDRFRDNFKKSRKDLVLSETFPSERVRAAYYHPEVDDSNIQFEWGVPDLDALREFLMESLSWSQEKVDTTLIPIIQKMNQKDVSFYFYCFSLDIFCHHPNHACQFDYFNKAEASSRSQSNLVTFFHRIGRGDGSSIRIKAKHKSARIQRVVEGWTNMAHSSSINKG